MKWKRKKAEAVPVTPRQFIKAWQESSSVAEVAAKVRRKKNACRVRAFRYRKMGVPLKVFPFVELPETDWEELSQYATELLPEHANASGNRPEASVSRMESTANGEGEHEP